MQIKNIIPNSKNFYFKDLFGKNIGDKYYKELGIKYVEI